MSERVIIGSRDCEECAGAGETDDPCEGRWPCWRCKGRGFVDEYEDEMREPDEDDEEWPT